MKKLSKQSLALLMSILMIITVLPFATNAREDLEQTEQPQVEEVVQEVDVPSNETENNIEDNAQVDDLDVLCSEEGKTEEKQVPSELETKEETSSETKEQPSSTIEQEEVKEDEQKEEIKESEMTDETINSSEKETQDDEAKIVSNKEETKEDENNIESNEKETIPNDEQDAMKQQETNNEPKEDIDPNKEQENEEVEQDQEEVSEQEEVEEDVDEEAEDEIDEEEMAEDEPDGFKPMMLMATQPENKYTIDFGVAKGRLNPNLTYTDDKNVIGTLTQGEFLSVQLKIEDVNKNAPTALAGKEITVYWTNDNNVMFKTGELEYPIRNNDNQLIATVKQGNTGLKIKFEDEIDDNYSVNCKVELEGSVILIANGNHDLTFNINGPDQTITKSFNTHNEIPEGGTDTKTRFYSKTDDGQGIEADNTMGWLLRYVL